MSEERVPRLLRELREADEGRGAGAGVETRVMAGFRRRRRAARAWTAMKIAAAVVMVAGSAFLWRGLTQAPETMTVQAPLPPAPPAMASAKVLSRPARRRLHEVVTQFYPLMDAPPPFDRGELVRVSLPASALERAGFLVAGAGPDDRVPADVLFGEEGLARAIRFVSYQ